MDFEFQNESGRGLDFTEEQQSRLKTSQRIRFDAEIEVIKKQYGGLESMRQKLNLSRRQLCRILMVDPSAWTRWAENGAPAHVYKTLALIIERCEKNPQTLSQYNIGAQPVAEIKKSDLTQLKSEIERQQQLVNENMALDLRQQVRAETHSQIETLRTGLAQGTELTLGWKLLLILNVVLVLYALFR